MIIALLIIFGALIITIFLLNFYRDPKREVPKGKVIVSPADGKVIRLRKVNTKTITENKAILGMIMTKNIGKEAYVLSIFMSPVDVHINCAPMSGKVVNVCHLDGRYRNAKKLEKSLLNEKSEIDIETDIGLIRVIQIAGFIARRIQTWVKKGQNIEKGQKLGRIVLGSQVTLLLPTSITLKVQQGDRVKAYSSILATYD